MGIIIGELLIFGLGFAIGVLNSDSAMAKSVKSWWGKAKEVHEEAKRQREGED